MTQVTQSHAGVIWTHDSLGEMLGQPKMTSSAMITPGLRVLNILMQFLVFFAKFHKKYLAELYKTIYQLKDFTKSFFPMIIFLMGKNY